MSVREACAACFEAHQKDCSGFAKAVATVLHVPLAGMANDIADLLQAGGGWERLASGAEAGGRASAGQFALGALRGDLQAHPDQHGHVVVVVDRPPPGSPHPVAWWGSLGGQPAKDKTINWAWAEPDRAKVAYAAWTGAPAPGAAGP